MRNKFLRILLLAGASLTLCVGLQAATKVGTGSTVYGPTAVAQVAGAAPTAAYLGASTVDAANKDEALVKFDLATNVVTKLAPENFDKVNGALAATLGGNISSPIFNNTISNITLFNGQPVITVPALSAALATNAIADNKKRVILVTDTTAGKEVQFTTLLKDGNDAGCADVDNPAVALAANANYIFAAVPGATKAWKDHDGKARGIAVIRQDANQLKASKPAALNTDATATAGEGAFQINHAVDATVKAAFGATAATSPLAIKWGVAPSIAGAELTDKVNMYWNDDISRLYVGLSGVKRDDPAKEGGVCDLLLGKIEGNAFTLAPVVKSMTAPRSDVENAAKKVAVANAACVVAEALAGATSAENAKYIAIAARAAAAAAGVTLTQAANTVDALAVANAVARAIAEEEKNQSIAVTYAGAPAGVAAAFTAGWIGRTQLDAAGTLRQVAAAADAIANNAGGRQAIAASAEAGYTGAGADASAAAVAVTAAVDGLAEIVANVAAVATAAATDGASVHLYANTSVKNPAGVIDAAVRAQGTKSYVASASAIAGMLAVGTVAARLTGDNAAGLTAGVSAVTAVKSAMSSLGVAMAKAINADAITGVDAMMAVNAVIRAYHADAIDTRAVATRIAAARAKAQEYIDNIAYSDVALAMKKVKAIADVPVDTATHPGADIAATAAASIVEVLAGASRAGIGVTSNKEATKYSDAIKYSNDYVSAKSAAFAKLMLEKAVAFSTALGTVGTAAVYDDTVGGFSGAQQKLATAQTTATQLETYLNTPNGVLDTTKGANILFPIAAPLLTLATASKTSATIATPAAALTAYANQKVAANDATRMVTNYFAPVDAKGNVCNKTTTLDAIDPDTDRARIVNVFNRNGSDDVAITAGKMVSLVVNKGDAVKECVYMIVNAITSAPAQMAGGLFISGSKNLICALPVLGSTAAAAEVGTISKVVNGVATFDAAASTMAELPSVNDAAVVVGGGKALFGGTWVKDIFTDANNNVYVALGGYKPAYEGIFKSTAIVNTAGAITGWTAWKRVKGLNQRIMAAAYDPTTGKYMFLGAEQEGGSAVTTSAADLAKFYSNINTVYATGATEDVIDPATAAATSLTKIIAGSIAPAAGGVFNVFNYDENTPGFAEGQMSMLVSVGFDKLTIARTGKWADGSLTPETVFASTGATQNVIALNDPTAAADVVKGLAPLTSTAIVDDASGQAWLFAGGSNGLAVYRLTADGSGLKNFTGKTYDTAAGVTKVFDPTLWSFKKIGDTKFNGVRKLLKRGNALWVVTETTIYAIGVAANKFDGIVGAATTAPLGETVVMKFDPDTMGYVSDVLVLDNNVVVVATTKGMYVFKQDTATLAWAVDAQYATLGPVTQLNYTPRSAGKGDLFALFANFAEKTGKLVRYAVDTTSTTVAGVVTALNKEITLGGFYLNFATDGAVAVVNSPTEGTVKVVELNTTATPKVIDQDFTKGGAPAFDNASGKFVIPGDEGLMVN